RLVGIFRQRLIALGHEVEWPPSPDLTPMGFFPFGYLKIKVYRTPLPRKLEELRQTIAHQCALLRQENFIQNCFRAM
ncbi:hypothetical protein, partial [Acinetobacter baumannii]|uniref:hypothetical protein n=1 Tax=Acinetobacter baumannii TaxID=470 RepID=UPI001C07778B